MSGDVLIVLGGGRELGRVHRDPKRNRLRFLYSEQWRTSRTAYALSLSMPLAAAEHGHAPIEAFLWGLLPDNEIILQRWARNFQVSARNPFALIAHVGEDCPGAVQFVLPDRIEQLEREPVLRVQWIDEQEIAKRLRALHSDQAAWRATTDIGQFSLAGAQPKTALYFDGKRFGVPAGRTPTTHILKPPIAGLEGQCENEHFCLNFARALGLPAASSQVKRFRDETAIVIERYDRVFSDSRAADAVPVLRVHQEDLCQALAVLPGAKYQSEGGPTPERIVALLRGHSSRAEEDVMTFVDALAFNWILGGTDAHAKNYSLLHGPGGSTRLAPLYDLVSALPYFPHRKIKLAMKIGNTYRMHEIGEKHWRDLARTLGLDEDQTLSRIVQLIDRVPDAVAETRRQAKRDGLVHPIIGRLAALLTENASRCRRQI